MNLDETDWFKSLHKALSQKSFFDQVADTAEHDLATARRELYVGWWKLRDLVADVEIALRRKPIGDPLEVVIVSKFDRYDVFVGGSRVETKLGLWPFHASFSGTPPIKDLTKFLEDVGSKLNMQLPNWPVALQHVKVTHYVVDEPKKDKS